MSTATPGTLTFLMTDVKGSTGLWEHHPDRAGALIERHEEIVTAAVLQFGGSLVRPRGEGDSLFSVFPSARGAILAAAKFHADLAAYAWPSGLALRVRAGIHTGEAQLREGDYYGQTVNRCARIREVASAGQTLISGTAAALAREAGMENELVDLGNHRLRDLLLPEHLYQLASDETFPPLRTLSLLRNNLPVQPTSFVGRGSQLYEIGEAAKRSRLTTLVGPGGSGKTRLALQYAAESTERMAGGVWLVELAPLNSELEILASIADVLGVGSSPRPSIETLTSAISSLPETLLLLDNCEHVVSFVARIADRVLRSCPGMRLIATSREPLRVAGEATLRVPTLDLPSSGHEEPGSLQGCESVDLFTERARSAHADFSITSANATTVAQICRRLDGIPLAIEHAASMVPYLSPSQILSGLDDRFRFLESEEQNVPSRHRSLQATIDWSFEMLSEDERTLFLAVSVFPDSFTLDAAGLVVAHVGLSAARSLTLVRRLVDKSLLVVQFDEDEARYRMLETIRQYASEHAGEFADVAERAMIEYSILEAAARGNDVYGPNQARTIRRLDADASIHRRALTLLRDANDPRFSDLALAFRRYWLRRGHIGEGMAWLRDAMPRTDDLSSQARIQNTLGAFSWHLRDLEAAQRYFAGALAIWDRLGDDREIATSVNNLGLVSNDAGDYEGAIASYGRAVETYRRIGDLENLPIALHNLGFAQVEVGRHDEAERSFREALEGAVVAGDEARIAIIRSSLGDLLRHRKSYVRAAEELLAAFGIWRRIEDPLQVANSLLDTALLAADCHHAGDALRCLDVRDRILAEAGTPANPRIAAKATEIRSRFGASGRDALDTSLGGDTKSTHRTVVEMAIEILRNVMNDASVVRAGTVT